MRKLFSFIAVMLVALTVNVKAAEVQLEPGTGVLYSAVAAASAGDVLILADGVYTEPEVVELNKSLTIKAAPGAHPVTAQQFYMKLLSGAQVTFIGIKFDGGLYNDGQGANDHCIRPYDDSANKELTLIDCEFCNWKSYILYPQRANRCMAKMTLDGCYFHNNTRGAIYIETGSSEPLPLGELVVENSTFIGANTYKAIDLKNGGSAVADAKLRIDHCTFYDCGPVRSEQSIDVIINNSIFAAPEGATYAATTLYGGAINNCLAYNVAFDATSTKTACLNVDPMFVDAANGDLHLGEGSPALTAGTDGGAIGDPRWSAAPEPAKPEVAPAAPAHEEEDVMAVYCNKYTTNTLNFNVLGWGGVTTWQTLDLSGTNVLYCTDMKWEIMTNWDADHYDMSAYKHLHFDVWVPQASHIKLTIEALDGKKPSVDFALNEGWNTIDADPTWWKVGEDTYDWTNMRYVIFEGYKLADGETSAEGTPFAFTNIYFWNDPAPKNLPATAPAVPTLPEEKVQALFSATYQERTFNFEPTSWGTQWVNYTYPTGEQIFHTESFGWDAFTNWGVDHYDLNAYDMMHADVYVTVDANLKFTIEALGAGDGGSGWKNGAVVEGLKANQWNSVNLDLLNAPFDAYDFKDMRYLILEGFTSEGTPLSIANVYFYNSMDMAIDNVDADKVATKRIIDGQLVIEKNGVKYNAQGTVVK